MAMDFVERSHNHMSTDIGVSQGPGRNFTNSVARVACREMKEAHVARGGVDFTSSESLTRALGCGGVSDNVTTDDGSNRSRHPGSTRVVFQNSQMVAIKAAIAPDRSLTSDELRDARSL